ncbi:PRC-barrel domain containing protein [Sulfitobacter sp. M39]|uniref:PRC-barrel domain-containing protein n=1 Tax=Sulfitobacter sp. M39 TaxID=2675334 RepID=UPI001F363F14|nr:PRC-barrel domain-containing protein [Sulfitobacter sp. M39]MCF7746838.1 PRC-barrel domain containing protein [Sulfitobacter sp. M39]
MKRILGTTAIILSLTGPAFADAHAAGFGTVTAQETDFFASDLIGMRIYNSETEVEANSTIAADGEKEWDDIGEINDVLLDSEGNVKAVILGIGGFLGMGERDVSVNMDEIRIVTEEGDSDDRFLVVNTSKEMLEKAPAFERMDDEANMETEANMDANADMNAETDMAATDVNAEAEVDTETEMEADAEALANEAEMEAEEAAAETEQAVDEATTEMADGANELEQDMERPMLTAPAVEREGYANATTDEVAALTAEDLEGSYVYGANDETVGEIGALVMGDNGEVGQVVINVGGFLGIGEKPVAVTWDELQIMKNAEGDDFRIYIDSSEEALEAQPEYQG